MFGLGPAYLFIVQHRLPIGLMRDGWRPWISTMTNNLAIVLVAGLLIWLVGIKAFLLIHLPVAAALRLGRRLAVLRPASVRAHEVGQRTGLEPARGRPARQLALRPAGLPALVHRQHRRPSRSSSQQPHPLLPAAACAARPSRAARCRTPDLCCRASAACASSCGTRRSAASCRSARRASSRVNRRSTPAAFVSTRLVRGEPQRTQLKLPARQVFCHSRVV